MDPDSAGMSRNSTATAIARAVARMALDSPRNLSVVPRLVTPVGEGERAGAAQQPLFVEFVNTLHWYEGAPIELLGDPAALAAWLAEQGLPATGADRAL